MTYQIKTINLTKFLWTVIIGVTLSVVGMIFLSTQINSTFPIYLMIPLVILIFIVAQKLFGRTIEIKLDNSKIGFLGFEIPLNEILGYYIDDNTSMSAFNLKLKNGVIQRYTITTTGKWKVKYFNFVIAFKSAIQTENPDAAFLEYGEVYPRSGRFIDFTVFLSVPLVLIVDLITLLTWLQGQPFFPWEVLLVNISLLTLIPYARKNKR